MRPGTITQKKNSKKKPNQDNSVLTVKLTSQDFRYNKYFNLQN